MNDTLSQAGLDEIKQCLSELSSDTPAHQDKLRELIVQYLGSLELGETITIQIRELVHLFHTRYELLKFLMQEICQSSSEKQSIRFYAFYSLYTFLRRNKSIRELQTLITFYGKFFIHEPLYEVVLSNYYRYLGEDFSTTEMSKSMYHAERAYDHPVVARIRGVKANFAIIVSIAGSNGIPLSEEKLQKAVQAIEDEILIDPDYGKYYFIRAKLKFFQGEFLEAIKDINDAIEHEDKQGKDALLRLIEYSELRTEIRQGKNITALEKRIADLQSKTLEISEDINENRTKIIEYITFFSGIIAFIVSTIQISLHSATFTSYAGLILLMSALLMFSFSSFMILIHGFKRKGRTFLLVQIPVFLILVTGIIIGLNPWGW